MAAEFTLAASWAAGLDNVMAAGLVTHARQFHIAQLPKAAELGNTKLPEAAELCSTQLPEAAEIRITQLPGDAEFDIAPQDIMGGAIAWATLSVLCMLSCVGMLLTVMLSLDPLLAATRLDPIYSPSFSPSRLIVSGPIGCELMSRIGTLLVTNKPNHARTALIRQVSPNAIPMRSALTLLLSSDQSKIYGINQS